MNNETVINCKLTEEGFIDIKPTKFLFPMLCINIILTACSKTENVDIQIQESKAEAEHSINHSTMEKSDIDYTTVEGKTYHILVDEYFETNDENNPTVNVLFRKYQVYDGNLNNVYSAISSVSLPKEIETITEEKEYLQKSDSEW